MNVLLIDDHEIFCDGMELVLAKLDKNIKLSIVSSYEEAEPLFTEIADFDLVLLDLGLPGLSDIEALKAVRQNLPASPVVVLSSNDDGGKVNEILNLGAQGYIPKSTKPEVLIRALKLVLSGGVYIPSEILSQTESGSTKSEAIPVAATDVPLTPRQYEVLTKLVHGHSNKEIGHLLGMAESTVQVHIAAILKAMKVTNRTRAAHIALQKGWATLE